jgi:hypothetical protein
MEIIRASGVACRFHTVHAEPRFDARQYGGTPN